MLTSKKREEIVDRIGSLGDLVVDLAYRLKFPIEGPSELAGQFPETQKIVIGTNHFSAAQIASHIPDKMFPLESFDDLIKKLEDVGLNKVYPSSLKEFVSQQSMVGYSLKKDDAFFKNGVRGQDLKLGGPGDLPPLDVKDQTTPKQHSSIHDQQIEQLGPLGNMVIDIMESIHFPITNAMDLADQFEEEEHFIFGANQIPISQVALMLPPEFFPLKSKEGTLKKLIESKFMELNPSNFQFLVNQAAPIGLMFEIDEKRLKEQAGNFKMESGGPGTFPDPDTSSKGDEAKATERAQINERLGSFGEMVYDIIEQRVDFPVEDPIDLSSRFKRNDFLINGLERIPMAKFALYTPESIFPLRSKKDLMGKLEKSGLKDRSEKDLVQFLNEISSSIGYSSPYSEKELIQISKESKMSMGGPIDSPNRFDKI